MKRFYQRFLNEHKDKIHLAAHSHHFWPDISLEGHTQYWIDSSKYSDQKWKYFLGEKLQHTQKIISQILSFDRPADIAFAPNTHELLFRLFSCFFGQQSPVQVLTSDSEFHSFARQLQALELASMAKATRLNPRQKDFEQAFLNAAAQADFIFISQVFFNTGLALSQKFMEKLVQVAPAQAIICIDGYHGFCAIPTNLLSIGDRIFYLAGGYKYAQAGEGMCFMTVPRNCQLRPVYTGWFANYAGLETGPQSVGYMDNGMRFWGSTQDMSAHYRFTAVWTQFTENGISVEAIDRYVKALQKLFIQNFSGSKHLISTDVSKIGHFLTLEFSSSQNCQKAHAYLQGHNILTDYRGNFLRFGFGPYITETQVHQAVETLNSTGFQVFLD